MFKHRILNQFLFYYSSFKVLMRKVARGANGIRDSLLIVQFYLNVKTNFYLTIGLIISYLIKLLNIFN